MYVCIGAGMTNQNARNYKNGGQMMMMMMMMMIMILYWEHN